MTDDDKSLGDDATLGGESPDGQTIASGSEDGTIKLWEVGPFLTELDRIKKKYADPSD